MPKFMNFLISKYPYTSDVLDFKLQYIHSSETLSKSVCITGVDLSRNYKTCTINQY